jgi:endonuclease/exonuclease/phosphatase family metal-dependent hydrolase
VTRSFQHLARQMDSIRPATRLGGTSTELGEYWLGDADRRWIPNERVRERLRAQPNRHSLGLAHKPDKGLVQQHRGQVQQSLREIVRRHDTGVIVRFLVYNTWLLNAPFVTSKPARKQRSREIGRALANSEYDVIGLTEVYRDPEKRRILREFGDQPVDAVNGPPASCIGISSGLWTLIVGTRVENTEETIRREFRTRGDEPPASKGFLYVQIDVPGDSRVDFVTTHMAANGEDERQDQILQLTEFLAELRANKPENVGIVVGDFNVRSDSDECGFLYERMAQCGYSDAWLTYGGMAGATGWDEDRINGYGDVCAFEGRVPAGGERCDDYYVPAATRLDPADVIPGNRIDYVFLEEPTPGHASTVDMSRIRRRPFWRGTGEHPDRFATPRVERTSPMYHVAKLAGVHIEPHYLSDHLALEFECLVAPSS